jgi:hypothetical protein
MLHIIKRNLYIIVTVSLGVFSLVLACILTYRTGYFRELNPDVEMNALMTIEWLTLLMSFVLTLSSVIFWLVKKNKLVVLIHLAILFAFLGAFIGSQLTFHEAYKERPSYTTDKSVA